MQTVQHTGHLQGEVEARKEAGNISEPRGINVSCYSLARGYYEKAGLCCQDVVTVIFMECLAVSLAR